MDPLTQLLVQGGTALVSLALGWLLRHLSVPKVPVPVVPPAPASPPAVAAHPVLAAFEHVLMDVLKTGLGQVFAQGLPSAPPPPPVVINQPAVKP